MACKDCGGNSQTPDEKIIEIAKQKAKETKQWVGLYRNEHDQLCIATGADPIQQWVTPDMQ